MTGAPGARAGRMTTSQPRERWLAADPTPTSEPSWRRCSTGRADALAAAVRPAGCSSAPPACAARSAPGRMRMNRRGRPAGRRGAGRSTCCDTDAATRPSAASSSATTPAARATCSPVDTARVLAGAGHPGAATSPHRVPTPVLAWSHHRARRCRRGDGHRQPQPARRTTATRCTSATARRSSRRTTPRSPPRIDAVDPTADRAGRRRRSADRAARRRGRSSAYLAAVPAVRLCPRHRACRSRTPPMHGVGGDVAARARSSGPGCPRPHVVERAVEPDPTFPTVSFPNPEEPGAMDLLLALAAASDADDRARQRSRRRPARRGDPDSPTAGGGGSRRRDRLAARRPHPAPHRRATTGW